MDLPISLTGIESLPASFFQFGFTSR